MDLLEFWTKSKETIDDLVGKFMNDLKDWEVLEMSKYIMRDGKRFRGTLLFLLNNALGGDEKDAYPGALATEILHSASLALDDIVDYDNYRRGKKAAWAIYTNRRVIFVSNFLIPTALNIISQYGDRALNISIELWKDTALGALKDMYGESKDYFKTIELKTASLFKLPTMLASFSSGKNNAIDLTMDLGKYLGIIYQLVDDYIDCVKLEREKLVGSAKQLFQITEGRVDSLVAVEFDRNKSEYLKILDSLPIEENYKDSLSSLPDFLAYGLLSEAGIKNKMF